MLSTSSRAISRQRAEEGRVQPDSAAVCLRDTSCSSTKTCAHMFPVEGHQASNYDEIWSFNWQSENHKGVSVWMSSFKFICMRSWVWKKQSEEIFKIWIIRYSRVTPCHIKLHFNFHVIVRDRPHDMVWCVWLKQSVVLPLWTHAGTTANQSCNPHTSRVQQERLL